jgi:hypothetical protein
MTFSERPTQSLGREFMQNYVANDQIEFLVGEASVFTILLRKMNLGTECLGSSMSVTEYRSTQIYGVNFGCWKSLGVRKGCVADRATHIQDLIWGKRWMFG